MMICAFPDKVIEHYKHNSRSGYPGYFKVDMIELYECKKRYESQS